MLRRLTKPLTTGVRSFAAKSKTAAIMEEVVDLAKFVPTNILKDGTHPMIKDKVEYPEWLFRLLDPKPTLGELERVGFDNITEMEEQHRFLVLLNRQALKTNNAEKAKK
ncbi:Mitochondrial/chloroplast ribosomal protein L54/L37 [Plasmopara halstedii]|uniref:Large ribosomal subunit protein mL54 n=1 Tax=Plasmopara halstedii TaxID=4781 RepID=A0A0P1AKG7_PLAHL|nr:Mitochondrial/chloroplast ribosomal protein L54/L37 [Plasmopara halstedii]CEG41062.1 Mitochondrial/chloroplast ribosomal protein L54/L37 [Plasmopara halstedii]|eukprot:XP_024577431.1 Mitochondrial/chloroplast ribosomal protein L54/L37 [Plasmopara halstedii]